MATTVTLGVPRTRMIERPYDVHRWARDIPSSTSKNLFYKWPHTGSWTLQPLQLTTDFVETTNWDSLKFRLTDVASSAGWWTEVPENTTESSPGDYFLSNTVSSTNYNTGNPSVALGNLTTPIGPFPMIADLVQQSSRGIGMLISNSAYPENQGYTLRFRPEGRGSFQRGVYCDFWFGQFVLRLNTNGLAQLFQSVALNTGTSYAYVYSFIWAESSQIHNRQHTIHIMPHARNKIEFLAQTAGFTTYLLGASYTLKERGTNGGGVYEVPGPIALVNDVPLITLANSWALSMSTEFRHHVQVSRIAFGNGQLGTASAAYLFDDVLDPQFICNQNLTFDADIDLPTGCSAAIDISDSNKSNPPLAYPSWIPPAQQMQFWVSFQGGGVVLNSGAGPNGCLRTPEFYGYVITKPAGYFTETSTPTIVSSIDTVLNFAMDAGNDPEQEHLQMSIRNDQGQVDAFCSSGQVNVEIADSITGALLFEGIGFGQTSTESPATEASILTLPCVGMADRLRRAHWGTKTPNFECDPNDANQGWLVADVIRKCFEQAGFNPSSEVVIEDEKYYMAPGSGSATGFRIWAGPEKGGATGGTGKYGSGHTTDAQPLGRFQPLPMSPVIDFLDWFLRDILGWHYVRGKDRKWHVYIRPSPTRAQDVKDKKFLPKVGFYATQETANLNPDGIPAYAMVGTRCGPIHRPTCSGIEIQNVINPSPSAASLAGSLGAGSITSSDDPSLTKTALLSLATVSNPYCYENTHNSPPNIASVDYIGEPFIETILQAEGLSENASIWTKRRLFEDNCRGWIPYSFEAPWGDLNTYQLRKYDCVLIQVKSQGGLVKPQWVSLLATIANITPAWSASTGKTSALNTRRMATYNVVLLRPDGPPPR